MNATITEPIEVGGVPATTEDKDREVSILSVIFDCIKTTRTHAVLISAGQLPLTKSSSETLDQASLSQK